MATILAVLLYIAVCGLFSILYFTGHLSKLLFPIMWATENSMVRSIKCDSNFKIPGWLFWVMAGCYHLVVLGLHMLGITELIKYSHPEISHSYINHPALMYIIWAVHTICYLLCIMTNPGIISKRNVTEAVSIYLYDGFIYKEDVKCRTCCLIKPARSKHCSVCNRCVMRFDHHCSWIHCCIGAYNYRYFMGILISAICMTVNGLCMSWYALQTIIRTRNLLSYSYIGSDGLPHKLEGLMLLQFLMKEYPRIFFVASSLLLLTVILGILTCYHIFLIINNTTTNESHKLGRTGNEDAAKFKLFYKRGVITNIFEVIWPYKSVSS